MLKCKNERFSSNKNQQKCKDVYFIIQKIYLNFFFRLFYAGAVEGQMPEILSMIQVNKMTPAPAVLVVVSVGFFFINRGYHYKFYGRIYEKKLYNESYYFQAFLSLVYLCSSDIYALINYTGFATWVNFFGGFFGFFGF